jgi:hypothetical protein
LLIHFEHSGLKLHRDHGEHPDFVATKFVRIASLASLVKLFFLMQAPPFPTGYRCK